MLTSFDRLLWVGLRQVWSGWRGALVFVQPDTVVRWHREEFRRIWARLSQHRGRRKGRPAIAAEIRQLILRMAAANPLWRTPRIHGELKMLGIEISERTDSRILRTVRRMPSQTWNRFLKNHLGQMVSVDSFAAPTIRFQILYVFQVLAHRRREVLRFNVTEHPTAEWTSRQLVEAFADRDAPRFLIRDRDRVYGSDVPRRLESLGVEEVLTAPQSPWQNAYAERLIGSIRRECLNHIIVLNARHMKRTLTAYFRYCHESRSHLALEKQCPIERRIMQHGAIVEIAQLGGLHHPYQRVAA